jgi:hypothetical protein
MPCDERVFWTDVVGNALEIGLLILVFVGIWRARTLLPIRQRLRFKLRRIFALSRISRRTAPDRRARRSA